VANRKKTLLLVDDDQDQLIVRKSILERSGYEVFTAGDAQDGVHLFKAETPDAVVLDYEMPRVNGGVLARIIRRANEAVPIVMLSGCTAVPASALRAVNRFIPKPTAPSVLIETIEFLIQRRSPEALA
jgi:DNA-binding response OmpR family regulator